MQNTDKETIEEEPNQQLLVVDEHSTFYIFGGLFIALLLFVFSIN